jgi:hypothetical protein
MTDHDNDIDALLEYLDAPWRKANHKIALALIAERDALKQRVAELEAMQPEPTLSRALQLEQAQRHDVKEGGGA